jgi:CheY-like chemotaxis protein
MDAKRVLIIDDDEGIAELFGEFCVDLGCVTKCVSDSRAALGVAVEFKPDLVLLDMAMPHLNGMQVLEQFRTHPATQSLAVIVISALAQEIIFTTHMVRAKLAKPVRMAAFREKVGGVLAGTASN